MSDIETEKFRQIGIDLINEYRQQRGIRPIQFLDIRTPEINALIRSIQLHEKTKKELADCKQELADCKQKVSDVAEVYEEMGCPMGWEGFEQFIIPKPKPDPLIEVLRSVGGDDRDYCDYDIYVKEIRAALDAAGFEIREKNDD